MTGIYADVIWTEAHGFVVVVAAPNVVTAYVVETDARLWTTPTPGALVSFLRACEWPDHSIRAVGQLGKLGGGSGPDPGVLVSSSGVETIVAQNFGQNCALVTVEDGIGVVYFQTLGTSYWRQVDGQPGSNNPIPIGPTSQGWLDYDPTRGGLVWTDTHRIMTVDGVTMVCAMQRGGTWVGQSPTASPDEAIG